MRPSVIVHNPATISSDRAMSDLSFSSSSVRMRRGVYSRSRFRNSSLCGCWRYPARRYVVRIVFASSWTRARRVSNRSLARPVVMASRNAMRASIEPTRALVGPFFSSSLRRTRQAPTRKPTSNAPSIATAISKNRRGVGIASRNWFTSVKARRSSEAVEGNDALRDWLGDQLVEWGKVAMLETRGRVSGRLVQTAVGYVEQTDGTLLLAAGSDDADWALNLRAQPRCRARIGDDIGDYEAHELLEDDRSQAISALILKYGTPAERLGRGPAFRLDRQVRGNEGGR